ncbi:MAG: FmdB family zinc ribbon protein [Candidatus Heimdallarchaeota archaeon]
MPIYDFECDHCGHIEKDFLAKRPMSKLRCPKCKKKMKLLFNKEFQIDVMPNGGLYLEHVSATGQTFHSKKEMRKFERDNNMELGALL